MASNCYTGRLDEHGGDSSGDNGTTGTLGVLDGTSSRDGSGLGLDGSGLLDGRFRRRLPRGLDGFGLLRGRRRNLRLRLRLLRGRDRLSLLRGRGRDLGLRLRRRLLRGRMDRLCLLGRRGRNFGLRLRRRFLRGRGRNLGLGLWLWLLGRRMDRLCHLRRWGRNFRLGLRFGLRLGLWSNGNRADGDSLGDGHGGVVGLAAAVAGLIRITVDDGLGGGRGDGAGGPLVVLFVVLGAGMDPVPVVCLLVVTVVNDDILVRRMVDAQVIGVGGRGRNDVGEGVNALGELPVAQAPQAAPVDVRGLGVGGEAGDGDGAETHGDRGPLSRCGVNECTCDSRQTTINSARDNERAWGWNHRC